MSDNVQRSTSRSTPTRSRSPSGAHDARARPAVGWTSALVAAVLASVAISACSGDSATNPAGRVVAVTVDPSTVEIEVGGRVTIDAAVRTEGRVDAQLEWSSDDEAVATVDASGTVVGVAQGSTTVVAASRVAPDVRAVVAVDVVPATPVGPDAAPTLDQASAVVIVGSRMRVSWVADDASTIAVEAVADDGRTTALSDALGGDVTEVVVPLPASAYRTVRITATNVVGSDVALIVPSNVVTRSDDYDPYDAGGRIPDAVVPGTLRAVLADAPAGSVVGFAADVREVALSGVEFDAPIDAHLTFREDVVVSGPPEGVTLRATASDEVPSGVDPFTFRSRVAHVAARATVVLENLTVTGGTFIYYGAGIRNDGILTLRNVHVQGNRAWDLGGGVYNAGTLVVEGGSFAGNVAATLTDEVGVSFPIRGDERFPTTPGDEGYGGAIVNAADGRATIRGTTFSGNAAKYSGGAIYSLGDLVLEDVVVEDGYADRTRFGAEATYGVGGAIYAEGELTWTGGRVSRNVTTLAGGGAFVDAGGSASIENVSFEENVADYGGAVRHEYYGDVGPTSLTLAAVTFEGNVARFAGPDLSQEEVARPTTAEARGARPATRDGEPHRYAFPADGPEWLDRRR